MFSSSIQLDVMHVRSHNLNLSNQCCKMLATFHTATTCHTHLLPAPVFN